MASGRILMAENVGLAEPTRQLLKAQGAPDLFPVADGGRLVTAFTKLAKAGKPPKLIILDEPLRKVCGRSVALCVRAIERAMGMSPTAILFFTAEPADPGFKTFLAELGRAVHLQRPEQEVELQARRLGQATARLLAQLGGT